MFKVLVLTFAASLLSNSCGKSSGDDTPSAATSWTDVNAVVSKKCAVSGCHASGASTDTCGDFTASEEKYKAAQACKTSAKTPAFQLNNNLMPKTGYTITDSERSMLANFK